MVGEFGGRGADRARAGRPGRASVPPAGPPVTAGGPDPPRRTDRPRDHGHPRRAAVVGRTAPGRGPGPRRACEGPGSRHSPRTQDDRDGLASGYRRARAMPALPSRTGRGESSLDPAPVARESDASEASSPAPVLWPRHIPIAYLAVSVGMAAWWLFGQLLLWRVSRAARPARGAVRDRFLAISGPAGDRVRLLESDRIALPFTYTWTRPVILLPASLCGGDDDQALGYCLAHEWSHVERRDAWAWSLAALAGMLLYLPAAVLVAPPSAPALPGPPRRRPRRGDRLARRLRRLSRPARAIPAVRIGTPGAGRRRPAFQSLSEGRHARPGSRTAGASLPDGVEPGRRA